MILSILSWEITFNDFQDALRLLTVKETKQEEGIFLISDLGKLSQEGKL